MKGIVKTFLFSHFQFPSDSLASPSAYSNNNHSPAQSSSSFTKAYFIIFFEKKNISDFIQICRVNFASIRNFSTVAVPIPFHCFSFHSVSFWFELKIPVSTVRDRMKRNPCQRIVIIRLHKKMQKKNIFINPKI